MERTPSFSFFIGLVFLILTSCAQDIGKKKNEGMIPKDVSTDASKSLSLEWGESANDEGEVIPSGLGDEKVQAISGSRRAFCFDNLQYQDPSHNCKRAGDDINSVIFNNPVAIQSFQLNFTRLDGQNINLTGLNFTTAYPMIDTESKRIVFRKDSRKTWGFAPNISADCSLSQPNTVGYESAEGKEKILTGLQLFDTATYYSSLGRWGDARLKAGRVWVSGFFPDPLDNKLFNFTFVPVKKPSEIDFGYSTFVESGSSTNVAISPVIGITEDTPDKPEENGEWKFHVLVGFCIKGTKTGGVQGTRPLILRSEVRVFDTVRLIEESNSEE